MLVKAKVGYRWRCSQSVGCCLPFNLGRFPQIHKTERIGHIAVESFPQAIDGQRHDKNSLETLQKYLIPNSRKKG